MLLSNLESVPGHTITQQLDVVYGSTVRSKHAGRDLMAGLKNIAQGASELFVYGTAVRVEAIAPKLANPFPAQG